MSAFRELPPEGFRLHKVDVANRQVVRPQALRRQWAGQLADDPLPLTLRRLVLGHPESSGQGHVDLILSRSPVRFTRRAAHDERSGRAPTQPHRIDFAFLASVTAAEGWRQLPGHARSCYRYRRSRERTEDHAPRVIPSRVRIVLRPMACLSFWRCLGAFVRDGQPPQQGDL
jgi:hypothetical protein